MNWLTRIGVGLLSLSLATVLGMTEYKYAVTRDRSTPYSQVTIEQRYSHLISMVNEDGDETSSCTATAVGPHAILTAQHCDPRMSYGTLRIDLSPYEYKILAYKTDEHEHLMLLLDGPPFTTYKKMVANVPRLNLGEKVHFYGFPRADYPSHALFGKSTSCDNYDYSDLDQSMGEVCFNIHAVGGDSGALILDSKEQPISIVSLADTYGKYVIGYALFFNQEAYDVAYTFDPEKAGK